MRIETLTRTRIRIISHILYGAVFVVCYSLFLDAFHIFWWLGLPEPFNLTGWYGRPDHHPFVFLVVYPIIGAYWWATLSIRWDSHILRWYNDKIEKKQAQETTQSETQPLEWIL